ncbi:MAG: NUDIX domain-containing protein, partial [Candidatus Thorarchaeota archaeon]
MREGIATIVLRTAPGGHEFLLLKRATKPFLGEWFLVQGGIDPGENPDDAVIRELREETQLAPLAVYRESTCVVPSKPRHVRLYIYVSFVSGQHPVVLNEEHMAFRWCSLEKALQLLPRAARQERKAVARVQSRFVDSL